MKQDILFFNKKYPVEITKIITFEIPRVLEKIVQPTFRLIVKLFLITIITLLIMIYNFKSTIIIFLTVLLITSVLQLNFQKKIILIGEDISFNQSKCLKQPTKHLILLEKLKYLKKLFF